MAKIMKTISVISLIMTVTFTLIYQIISNDIVFSLIITFGTITYHFVIRLMAGGLINFFMKNKADYTKKVVLCIAYRIEILSNTQSKKMEK